MSALAGLFRKGGHNYRTIPDIIALLPRGMQHAADVAMKCVLRLKAKGKLDETATDKELARESERMAEEIAAEKGVDYEGTRGWSPSLLQKGLHAADVELRKIGAPPLIGRESGIGMHGRRRITVMPLAGKEQSSDPGVTAVPPPAPPPGKTGETEGTATTGGASPSSPSPAGIGPELPPDLVDAVGLLPDLSRERLTGWVLLAGVDLTTRAVAWLRIWLQHPEPQNRPRQAWWAEKALLGWKAKLDRGLMTMADIDEMIEAKARKWGRKLADDQAAARRAEEKARETAEETERKAREERVKRAWGLLGEPQRQAIRAAAMAANPALRKLPAIMLEAECLTELERRMDAGAAEPHPRE